MVSFAITDTISSVPDPNKGTSFSNPHVFMLLLQCPRSQQTNDDPVQVSIEFDVSSFKRHMQTKLPYVSLVRPSIRGGRWPCITRIS